MKQLTISADSWHFKLATFGALKAYDNQTDLCRYFWAIVRGILRAPSLILLGVAVGWMFVVAPVMAIVVWALHGRFVPDDSAILGFGVWLILALIVAKIAFDEWRDKLPRQQHQPSLVKTAYRGWKEKTCVLVEVKDAP
jgi:hypothetical protein